MSLLQGFIPQPNDSQGRTLPYAKLYSYSVGSFTPKTLYQDAALTIPASNPVIADGSGNFQNLYIGSGGYKLVLQDQYGVTIWTQDNYYSNLTGSDLTNINTSIAATQQQLSTTFYTCNDTSASTTAYTVTNTNLQSLPTSYQSGMIVLFSVNNNNTGASTINVAGLGVKNLVTTTGAPLPANFLVAGTTLYQFIYIFGMFVFTFRTGQITSDEIPAGLITGTMIANNTVTGSNLVNGTVTGTQIATGAAYTYLARNSLGANVDGNVPYVLLANNAISSGASFVIDLNALDISVNDQNYYFIRLMGLSPGTNDTKLYMTLYDSTSAGYSGANYYAITTGTDSNAAALVQNGNGTAQAILCGDATATLSMSNVAGRNTFVDLWVYGINTTTQGIAPMISGKAYYISAAGRMCTQQISATNLTGGTSLFTRLQFAPSAGNWNTNGRYLVYKVNRAF